MTHPFLNLLDQWLDQSIIGGYSRIGYLLRQNLWNPADTEVDLSGKVCLITGANSGLGFATALALAQKKAIVYLGCRNRERGQKAVSQIQAQSGNTQVFLEVLDISDQNSIRDFAQRFHTQTGRLDILIHNAGALLNTRQASGDGLEMTLATHVLGPYLLTQLLLPLLQNSAPSRVIMVSSGGMYLAKLHLEDLQWQTRPYNGAMAYAEAKRGQVILTQLWHQAYHHWGIDFYAMHPGWADTPGVQSAIPGFRLATQLILRNLPEGADTIIWLASNPHLIGVSGKFYADRRPRPLHRLDQTRNSLSEIEDFWRILGQLTHCPQAFPIIYSPQ